MHFFNELLAIPTGHSCATSTFLLRIVFLWPGYVWCTTVCSLVQNRWVDRISGKRPPQEEAALSRGDVAIILHTGTVQNEYIADRPQVYVVGLGTAVSYR